MKKRERKLSPINFPGREKKTLAEEILKVFSQGKEKNKRKRIRFSH